MTSDNFVHRGLAVDCVQDDTTLTWSRATPAWNLPYVGLVNTVTCQCHSSVPLTHLFQQREWKGKIEEGESEKIDQY